jgi:hypothetical protein
MNGDITSAKILGMRSEKDPSEPSFRLLDLPWAPFSNKLFGARPVRRPIPGMPIKYSKMEEDESESGRDLQSQDPENF